MHKTYLSIVTILMMSCTEKTTLTDDIDQDGHPNSVDCLDTNPTVNPDAEEICDGLDNNCDGEVDEGVKIKWYADTDGDGYGNISSLTEACVQPPDHVSNDSDCDDNSPTTNPASYEICDLLDNDCDGEIDEEAINQEVFYADADGDGFGDADTSMASCSAGDGFVSNDHDCDDSTSSVNPDAMELCITAGIDDDCDGQVDEDDAMDSSVWHLDADGDGYGGNEMSLNACEKPPGFELAGSDCDDNNSAIHPGADELCSTQGVDDDCDGSADESDALDALTWYPDMDLDGYGDSLSPVNACDAPTDHVSDGTDCNDTDSDISPAADEWCSTTGIDDDCDGQIDEEDAVDTSWWYDDTDGDGLGDGDYSIQSCSQPTGYVDNSDDCDPSVNDPSNSNCHTDASESSITADGPVFMHGYAWYLSEDGYTCDAVCSDLGGANLNQDASTAWTDNCSSSSQNPDDVATYFYLNGNAGGWSGGPSSTSYHSMGYGYRNSQYYQKCAGGYVNGNGSFPGDHSDSPTRSVVCACYTD